MFYVTWDTKYREARVDLNGIRKAAEKRGVRQGLKVPIRIKKIISVP